MKILEQSIQHNPPELYGDCFRTALASILNLERDDVPHFNDGKPCDNYWELVNDWLSHRDLVMFSVAFEAKLPDVLSYMKRVNQDLYYLLAGKSPRGCSHQVVALNDTIVCDPAPHGGGLVGPCIEDDLYWVNVLLPRSIHRI